LRRYLNEHPILIIILEEFYSYSILSLLDNNNGPSNKFIFRATYGNQLFATFFQRRK
jgi:hypothetical protein